MHFVILLVLFNRFLVFVFFFQTHYYSFNDQNDLETYY